MASTCEQQLAWCLYKITLLVTVSLKLNWLLSLLRWIQHLFHSLNRNHWQYWLFSLFVPNTSWWRHQMETFSALLAICAGNSPVTGGFPAQRPVRRSFDVFFDLHLNNDWVNNREAGDLRCHRVHYDVTVRLTIPFAKCCHRLLADWGWVRQ